MRYFYELRRSQQGYMEGSGRLGWFSKCEYAIAHADDVSNGETVGEWQTITDQLQVADTKKHRYLIKRMTFNDPQ